MKAHGFGLDRYIEYPLTLEYGMAIAPMRPVTVSDRKALVQLSV
jgi:hypothetical protein